MSTLQVHITAGPQSGTRLQLNQSPVTFGRSAENALVLDVPVVSRQHGELILDEETGQWLLANFSQNGTRVGRKKVTKKPFPLTDGATVIIGDTEVFRVHLAQEEQNETASYADDESAQDQPLARAPGAGLKGRSKLWIGLGVWFALCIGLMIFFATMKSPGDGTTQQRSIWNPSQVLEDDDIDPELLSNRDSNTSVGDVKARIVVSRLLAKPLPNEEPDVTRYDTHLRKANEAMDRGSRELYSAYNNFQIAISVSNDPNNPFDDAQTRLDYDSVVTELATIISQEYMRGYRLYNQGNYSDAAQTLFNLRQVYYPVSNPDDELAKHIMMLHDSARSRMGR